MCRQLIKLRRRIKEKGRTNLLKTTRKFVTLSTHYFWTRINADYQDLKYKEQPDKIIKALYKAYKTFGYSPADICAICVLI